MLFKTLSLTHDIPAGAAHDVSFLIDFLPAYLFPSGERTIDMWAVAGVSLGGHSTWHCLKDGALSRLLPF